MKPANFEWDEENLTHVGRHSVEPDEAESVLDNDPLILKTTDRKYLAYGKTDDGRYLLVVFIRKSGPIIRIITARGLTAGEKQRLKRRNKKNG